MQPGDRSPAIGPVVVTDLELSLLEDAHLRLLGEDLTAGSSGTEHQAAPGAAAEARLSLVARGLLDEHGELSGTDGATEVVMTMLDVRLAADVVLVAERVVAAGPVLDSASGATGPGGRRLVRLVHVVGSGACVEDVLPDGAHHLHLLVDRDALAPWVTAATVPPDAAPGTGPPRAVNPTRPETIATELSGPTALVELSALVPDRTADPSPDASMPSAHHLVALGPAGCWVTDVDVRRTLPERVVFRPVDPAWVGEWVRTVLDDDPAGSPAVRGPGGEEGTMTG